MEDKSGTNPDNYGNRAPMHRILFMLKHSRQHDVRN
jgi:hypothetical protein